MPNAIGFSHAVGKVAKLQQVKIITTHLLRVLFFPAPLQSSERGITYRTTRAVFKDQYAVPPGFFLKLVQLFVTGNAFPIHPANIHNSSDTDLAFWANIL